MRAQSGVRPLRVAAQIKQCLSGYFMRHDFFGADRRRMMITVTDVTISPDLHVARVFILSSHDKDETMRVLSECDLRTHVASALKLKFAPRIECRFDELPEHVARIESLLQRIPRYADDVDGSADDGMCDGGSGCGSDCNDGSCSDAHTES